jgi:hypothetical protein
MVMVFRDMVDHQTTNEKLFVVVDDVDALCVLCDFDKFTRGGHLHIRLATYRNSALILVSRVETA